MPELRGAQVNIDAAIKAAQERVHRQIGQWTRCAHRKVRERAEWERGTMALRFIADDLK